MQPIITDKRGVARFKENAIVRFLLDEASEGRKCDLNRLAVRDFCQSDWEQFYQLIGYSICGYHELSMVSDDACLEASAAARQVLPGAGGCRDTGCEIHVGVARERRVHERQDREAAPEQVGDNGDRPLLATAAPEELTDDERRLP